MDKDQCKLMIELVNEKIEEINLNLNFNKEWNKEDVYTFELKKEKELCVRTLKSLWEEING